MHLTTLLPALDRLPSDPHTYLGLPAALAPYLSTVKRATRHPQPWTEYRLLAALALSGWSFRYSLAYADATSKGTDPASGQTKRAVRQLTAAGLWEEQRVRLTVHAVLVRLTPLGRSLLTEIGLTPVESEWERIERLHRGDTSRQLRHTAAICAFAYHARKRGYDTLVCPQVDGAAEPDILLTDGDESLYVEVQRQGGEQWRRAAKWRNLLRLQDEVILCTATPQQAMRYAREAQSIGADRGRITDLATLLRDEPDDLFTHQWTSKYMDPQPIVTV
jgi:hypothetical protein